MSRPYPERLAELGLIHSVKLHPKMYEELGYTLKDCNTWLREQGFKSKTDYVMTNWCYYFKDEKLATMFGLKFGGGS